MSLSGSQRRHLSVKIYIASKIKAYKDICLILQKVAHPAPLSPTVNEFYFTNYFRIQCEVGNRIILNIFVIREKN